MKKIILFLTAILTFGCSPESEVSQYGCVNNPLAVNYNPEAITDDGSCVMVYEVQNSLFAKFTATWCGPCGSWGGPAFVGVYNQHKGKICAMSLQINDALSTQLNTHIIDAFATKWIYSGTPSFLANDNNLNQSVGQSNDIITTSYQLSPDMAVGIGKTIGAGKNEGKFNLNIYVKSYKELQGQYNIAVYMVAKELVKNQNTDAGYDPNYIHHNVLLASATTGAWGEPIATNPKTGEVFHWSKAVDYTQLEQLYSTNRDNIEIVAVIWKVNGSGYNFVNCTTN